jgi:hypothetical protein
VTGSATGAAEAVEVDGVVRRDEAFGLGESVVACPFKFARRHHAVRMVPNI